MGKDFWVSFNPMTDTGESETALCQNKSPRYLILNGNYLKEYKPLIKKGYASCLKKYKQLLKDGAVKSVWSE